MVPIYEFGPFRLDADAEILFRGSEPVVLGRKATALLRTVLERGGTPVSKDALIEAAWPGLAVEDSYLTDRRAASCARAGAGRRRLDRDASASRLSLQGTSDSSRQRIRCRLSESERPTAQQSAGSIDELRRPCRNN